MKDERALALGWIRKGDSDLADARRTVASAGPYDTACFHAQQAVEKYLKSMLAGRGHVIPRTHDLEEIQSLCVGLAESSQDLAVLDLTELTGYAVEMRYDPEFWPEQGTAREALALAEMVRAIIVSMISPDASPEERPL